MVTARPEGAQTPARMAHGCGWYWLAAPSPSPGGLQWGFGWSPALSQLVIMPSDTPQPRLSCQVSTQPSAIKFIGLTFEWGFSYIMSLPHNNLVEELLLSLYSDQTEAPRG